MNYVVSCQWRRLSDSIEATERLWPFRSEPGAVTVIDHYPTPACVMCRVQCSASCL